MEAKEYIRRQIASMRRVSEAAALDLTDEQLNWAPPGTANPIGTTLVHTFIAEDSFVQGRIQGKSLVWKTGGWSEKIGLSNPPGRGESWDEIRTKHFSLAAVTAYGDAVRAATEAYLATITPEELEREVLFAEGKRSVADLLALAITHTSHHMGEVSALKGVQGAKGLPY